VSDEIYHGISYGEPTRSMLEFEPSALIVNSFSKYFSMVGWRLGWLLVTPELLGRARALFSNLFLTAPSLSQHAALAALDSHPELQAHIAVYSRNRDLLLQALPTLGLRDIAPPDGAFYLYANIAHLSSDSLGFCEAMLRATGVAAAPGVDFDPVEGRHFMRFSFAVSRKPSSGSSPGSANCRPTQPKRAQQRHSYRRYGDGSGAATFLKSRSWKSKLKSVAGDTACRVMPSTLPSKPCVNRTYASASRLRSFQRTMKMLPL
jgi:hypothetical protein